jgi:hypothetical protein
MLPRRSFLSYLHASNQGFFSIAAILILVTLAVAIYILSSQLKSPTNWLSKAAEVPDACTGTLEIPSCYEDGTPTALKVEWNADKNPDRDCNVYLNGSDPATQEVVSTECKGSKTYTYTSNRLLGNPLGNQDIYQLGLDNSLPGCTVKQLAEIRAEDACKDKKTAGPKPTAPDPAITANNCKKIIADFGLTYLGFSDTEICVISDQLTQLNTNFSLVSKIQAITKESRTQFKKVDTLTGAESFCSVTEINLPSGATNQTLKAKLLSAYTNLLLQCGTEQSSLLRQANNIWSEEGGITPATYNPSPLKSSPQESSNCKSTIAQIDRKSTGDIIRYDYIAVLASRVDPNYLKTYKQSLSDPYCTDQYPFANKSNPRQCQLAETVLNPKSASVCGQIQPTTNSGNTEFGMQINMEPIKDPSSGKFLKGYPTQAELDVLSPKWIRYVYHSQYGLAPLTNTKHLVIFNNQSASPAPIGSSSESEWNKYIDNVYLPALSKFLDTRPNISAIEIWNEPDLCDKAGGYCPYLPPKSFALMIKKAAALITQKAPQVTIVTGGVASGNTGYVSQVRQADPMVFSQVDALGLHPYGKSPQGFSISGQFRLQSGDLESSYREYAAASGLPVWATEVGFNATDQKWQADYLTKLFQVTGQSSPPVPVLIWYAWTDRFRSKPPYTWGMVDEQSNLKLSGKAFQQFTKGGQ